MTERALVIGADGLLGSHLVRELLATGRAVRIFRQRGSSSPTLAGLDIEWAEGDLLDDGPALTEAMQDCVHVFHCAAVTDLQAEPELTWRVNLEGTRRVVDSCLESGIGRLVFVGSASSFQFGPREAPGDEFGGFPDEHRGVAYMESKYEAMQLVLQAVRERGLDALVVAPTFLLGEYDWRPSSGTLIQQFLARRFPAVPPGGRNFAYAGDVATAMVAALDRGKTGEIYLLGGQNLSYAEFFTHVAESVGLTPPRWVLPTSLVMAAGHSGTVYGSLSGRRNGLNTTVARLSLLETFYSSDKARRELGLRQTPLETAIAGSLRSLREYNHMPALGEGLLRGKVALVSGASRGVGLATAKALVAREAKVVITARGERRLDDSRRVLELLGGEVEAVVGDVGSWADATRMVTSAIDRFGRLDLLINNAGVSMRGQFTELAPEVCSQTIGTNLLGSVYLTRAAAKHIVEARGSIVFISSIAGLIGLPGASTYCASKSALSGLAESLRLELGPKGVHVGVVYLGFTEHDPEKRILAADGSLVPPDRPAHNSQAFAAETILKVIEQEARQQIMTPIGNVGWIVHRLSPSLVEGLIARAQASQWKMFQKFS